jgi:hypothetical protein
LYAETNPSNDNQPTYQVRMELIYRVKTGTRIIYTTVNVDRNGL